MFVSYFFLRHITHLQPALFCSKDGAPQVKLKLVLRGDDAGHFFTFTAPNAQAEREQFKTELTNIIGRNKNAADIISRLPAPRPPPSLPVFSASVPTPTLPPLPSSQPSRAESVSSNDARATPSISGHDAARDFRLRKTVLLSNPELTALHRELVIGGHITEAEFWEGREVRRVFNLGCSITHIASSAFGSCPGSRRESAQRQIRSAC